jgi:hypothetical protein
MYTANASLHNTFMANAQALAVAETQLTSRKSVEFACAATRVAEAADHERLVVLQSHVNALEVQVEHTQRRAIMSLIVCAAGAMLLSMML